MGARQLVAARAIIAEIARHLRADCSVELWNGRGPAAGRRTRATTSACGSPRPVAIGRLIRSPRLTTLVEVYLAGDLDITGGSPLEALGRWDHLRAVHLKRHVDRRLVLKNAIPFVTARKPADAGMSFAARVRRIAGRGRDDQAMIQFHYDVSNAFYALFLGAEMQYSAAVFASISTRTSMSRRPANSI